jgi:hypothetical protein
MRPARAGIVAFSKTIAREHARHGITVNVVCPGPTDTALFADYKQGAGNPEKLEEAFRRSIPLGRIGQPDDLPGAILFFASDDAAYVTGQVLSVSGGLTMNGRNTMTYEDILYEVKNGVGLDHHQPPRQDERLSRAHLRGAHPCAAEGRLRQSHRLHRAGRRRRPRLLHRRRPVGPRGPVRRPRHHRPADRGTARRHPRRAQARDRPRAGFCHRRRQRAVHAVRHHHRRRQGAVRPGRPKVGSVDPGYGTALLARVVGEKKAREMWYLCRRYKAPEALAMGLVNAVVPHDELDAEVQRWADEIAEKSPTALAIAKRSFNMDTAHQAGIAGMGLYALKLYYDTEESKEGVKAFNEKRKPDFRKYAK